MMIRQAQMEDLSAIVAITKRAVQLMNAEGSDQWNESYPTIKHFATDIKDNSLYVYEEERIEGFIVLNQQFAEEYLELSWSYKNNESATLHRLAVTPGARSKGIAEKLFTFAETQAAKDEMKSIKIDTYSLNEKAQRLFSKLGYTKIGELMTSARREPFFYFEKTL